MRLLLLLAIGVVSQANAEIYKCIEDGGRVTYSNSPMKNCNRLNVGPPSSAPGSKSSVSSGRSASPEGFPRVGSSVQKTRDDERRRILELELDSEQNSLDAARRQLAEQEGLVLPDERNVAGRGVNGDKVEQRVLPYRDKVAQHERNVEALRKEIGSLR